MARDATERPSSRAVKLDIKGVSLLFFILQTVYRRANSGVDCDAL